MRVLFRIVPDTGQMLVFKDEKWMVGGINVLVNPTEPPRIRRKFRREFATALSAFLECASSATKPAILDISIVIFPDR